MTGTLELTPAPGLAAACRAMGLWRGSLGRHKARAHRAAFVGPALAPRPLRPRSPLALSEQERALVLQALCSERFTNTAPAAVHATLLDANANSTERRRQRSHPIYAKWSWSCPDLTDALSLSQ